MSLAPAWPTFICCHGSLDPVHPGWTIALIILAAATFTAIAHMLRVAAGVVGSAVTLVLLMLQLTSCAGIYPVQTLPAVFRLLHPCCR